MARQTTVKAFNEWVKDDAAVEGFLQRVAEVGRLRDVCMALKKPYTLMHPYLHSTPELKARYDAARAAWADKLHDEKLKIADRKPKDMVDVSNKRLQCEVREQAAKAYNRDRFGDAVRVEKTVTVAADAGLIGFAASLLEQIKAPAVQIPAVLDVSDAELIDAEPR